MNAALLLSAGASAGCFFTMGSLSYSQDADARQAQSPVAPGFSSEEEAIDRIIDTALRDGQAYAKLQGLCGRAPHRLSGSPGAKAAVAWARKTMIQDGLENVRIEPCRVNHWERGDVEELRISAPDALAGQQLNILTLGGSVPTPPAGIEGELIVVRSFEELAALGEAGVAGKIVLFNRAMDERLENTFEAYSGAVEQRVYGASKAARYGALASIVRSMTTGINATPHTGSLYYTDGVPRIPAVAVSTIGAQRLVKQVAQGVPVRVRLRLDCKQYPPALSHNVVGELVGTEWPDEIVVLGAHLDAWDVGEGAHDDGAGCVQAMEALRLIKSLGLRPRRTLRCVLFMNEENGLGGGKAYYADHRDELRRHVLAIESDRGGFTPRGFTAQMNDEAFEVFSGMVAKLGRTGAGTALRGGGGADIGPLAKDGVPLAGFLPDCQRYFDFHHSRRDVVAAVNSRELHLGAAAMAGLAWLAANADQPLPRAEPE